MPISAVAFAVFASLAAAVALGITMSGRLADHHLSSESRDTIKLTLGLMGTLAALLLGLLVNSAKESFDAEREQINALAAKVATLDRVLKIYGAEAASARGELRALIEGAVAQAWSSRDGIRGNVDFAQRGDAMLSSIQLLRPTDAAQSDLKVRATDLAFELIEGRSKLIAMAAGGVSVPVLTLVVGWLVVILFGFSLLAPRNAAAVTALFVSAAGVCGAVLLLLELHRPFDGLIQISSAPLVTALGQPAQ